jgi:hypothetical protein
MMTPAIREYLSKLFAYLSKVYLKHYNERNQKEEMNNQNQQQSYWLKEKMKK